MNHARSTCMFINVIFGKLWASIPFSQILSRLPDTFWSMQIELNEQYQYLYHRHDLSNNFIVIIHAKIREMLYSTRVFYSSPTLFFSSINKCYIPGLASSLCRLFRFRRFLRRVSVHVSLAGLEGKMICGR